MEGSPVVPDHEVTGLPDVAVNELALSGVLQKIHQ